MITYFTPKRILAIKLADLGDVLNITPALRALRETYPAAQLDVLVNPHTAALLEDSPFVDEVIRFPKTDFEGIAAIRPAAWLPLGRYMRQLRSRDYDTVVNFHHLTTAMGRTKQRALITATGARTTVGLDNGYGGWLTHPVKDHGFGAEPEVAYWLALADALGAHSDDTNLQLDVSDRRSYWSDKAPGGSRPAATSFCGVASGLGRILSCPPLGSAQIRCACS